MRYRISQAFRLEPLHPTELFISPHAASHFRHLLNEPNELADGQNTPWLIEQLEDFFLQKLRLCPASGLRKDAIHRGVRVQPYGFYDIYYFFNGKNIYIAHIEDRRFQDSSTRKNSHKNAGAKSTPASAT